MTEKLAYTQKELAEAAGVSAEYIRIMTRRGELVASYAGRKAIYARDEAERWIRSLPNERQTAGAV